MRYRARNALERAAIMPAALLLAALPLAAQAAGKPSAAQDPVYREECGACHLAYPPRFLGADSWRRIMQGLGDHFGSDARLDEQTTAQITALLVANARKKPLLAADGSPLLRITEAKWFRAEHRPGHHGLRADTFSTPPVNSPSNCGACHQGAESGRIGEGRVRVPAPLPATTTEATP